MPGPMRRGMNNAPEKAKDFKGTVKKLIKSYLAPYKWQIIVVLIFAIGSTIFSIVGPKILGNATTEIYNGLISKLSGGSGINFEDALSQSNYTINTLCYKYGIFINSRFCYDKCSTKSNIQST